jgi:drug/metabolite transporter (DMT)-like permease
MPKTVKGILYASITAVLWGILAIALKVSLTDLTPADITWFRFFMAFIVLAGFYSIRKPHYLGILRRPPFWLVVATIFLALNYYGFIVGVHLASPSIAQVFIQLGPVLLAMAGFIFFHEKVTWRQIAGLVLVAIGLVVFYNSQMNASTLKHDQWRTGIIWVLIAALAWAIYSILLKILVKKYPPVQLNLVIFGLPALLYLPFVRFEHFMTIGMTGWLILMFLGLNTLFAYVLISLAIQYIEANKVSVIVILNPLLTFTLMATFSHYNAKWIEHEHYTIFTLAGALLALAGAILTIFRKNKTGNPADK